MADHMVSLARKSQSDAPTLLSEDKPYYSHTMYLDKDEIEKLGIGGVKIGDDLMMMAHVKVVSISIHEEEGDEDRKNIDLSIRKAELKPVPTDAASKLFGS